MTAGVTGLADFADVRFSQLTRRSKRFYEDPAIAGEQALAYDCATVTPWFGNVTNHVYLGSPRPSSSQRIARPAERLY